MLIATALVLAGFAVPLTSLLVGKVTVPPAVERSLIGVAEAEQYRVLNVRRYRVKGRPIIEIDLAGSTPPSPKLLHTLRSVAESTGRKGVELRVAADLGSGYRLVR